MWYIRKIILLISCLLSIDNIQAQKEDYTWVLGYDGFSHSPIDTGVLINWGNTIMYYDGAKMDTERYWMGLNFVRTNASISDENGNLLFYTNGVKVYNSAHALMENGDTLNPSKLMLEKQPEMLYEGYRWPQAAIIIKKPDFQDLYYILHITIEHSDNPNIQVISKGIYFTEVDIRANNGLGKVIRKNVPLIEDTVTFSVALNKHANGEDWWILVQEVFTNCYYTILLTKDGFELKKKQCLDYSYVGLFCYSPNGNKFAKISMDQGVTVYDFDRCTGKLTNMKNMPIPDLLDSSFFGIGVSFSPNSRYLYATASVKVYQYDLEAPDIHASRVELTYWDGFHGPPDDTFFSILPTLFSTPQLAPDGKIYIGTGNATRFFHVIHDPDKKGKACNIQQHSFRLPTCNGSVPNFPNYRLGAKSCTTSIADMSRQLRIRTVYNSALAWLWIDYGNLDWSGDPVYSIQIHNTLGQVVEHRVLPMYSAYQHISTHTMADGVYLITILRNDIPLWNGKVVKE